MLLTMESMLLKTLLGIGGTIILMMYLYLRFIVYTYWKRKGLPYDAPNMLVDNAIPVLLEKISIVPSNEKITMIEAVAQAFLFFAAGFETISSTLTYCLYELSLNPEIQQTLQAEIDAFSEKSGRLTYDTIMHELKYLHMVFSETLRKHPTNPILTRICNEDTDIPNSDFRIEKETPIVISVSGLHSDPSYYPDPQKFDPSHFSKENIATRNPYTYLPFGEGPRNCIGMRLGILEAKMALITLLSNFNFSVCDKTPIPIHYSKKSISQTPKDGVYLKLERRNKIHQSIF